VWIFVLEIPLIDDLVRDRFPLQNKPLPSHARGSIFFPLDPGTALPVGSMRTSNPKKLLLSPSLPLHRVRWREVSFLRASTQAFFFLWGITIVWDDVSDRLLGSVLRERNPLLRGGKIPFFFTALKHFLIYSAFFPLLSTGRQRRQSPPPLDERSP